ncbi:unnamed protein product [Sphenostylis stenocarpa]|uniref:Uncharacterized protein n=1 Tax=Sphenostylis stenocarpa TaxID=92480 RepID=A0AA86VY51_9FABA|nr:unnamed protein product [Sphenostylis stenocarpa]
MAYNIDNDDTKYSTCLSDIDEWLEHANKFCRSSNHHTESVHSEQNGSKEEEDSRLSAMCNSYLVAPEHRELHNITIPCVREESPVSKGQTCLTCTHRTAKCRGYERTRLLGPYDEFFDDVRRRKQEAERDAHKTKHNDLERKQFKASVRTQKKICLVREKAEKQKMNLRRSTMKKFQQMQTSETHSPSEISWGSHIPLRR